MYRLSLSLSSLLLLFGVHLASSVPQTNKKIFFLIVPSTILWDEIHFTLNIFGLTSSKPRLNRNKTTKKNLKLYFSSPLLPPSPFLLSLSFVIAAAAVIVTASTTFRQYFFVLFFCLSLSPSLSSLSLPLCLCLSPSNIKFPLTFVGWFVLFEIEFTVWCVMIFSSAIACLIKRAHFSSFVVSSLLLSNTHITSHRDELCVLLYAYWLSSLHWNRIEKEQRERENEKITHEFTLCTTTTKTSITHTHTHFHTHIQYTQSTSTTYQCNEMMFTAHTSTTQFSLLWLISVNFFWCLVPSLPSHSGHHPTQCCSHPHQCCCFHHRHTQTGWGTVWVCVYNVRVAVFCFKTCALTHSQTPHTHTLSAKCSKFVLFIDLCHSFVASRTSSYVWIHLCIVCSCQTNNNNIQEHRTLIVARAQSIWLHSTRTHTLTFLRTDELDGRQNKGRLILRILLGRLLTKFETTERRYFQLWENEMEKKEFIFRYLSHLFTRKI